MVVARDGAVAERLALTFAIPLGSGVLPVAVHPRSVRDGFLEPLGYVSARITVVSFGPRPDFRLGSRRVR